MGLGSQEVLKTTGWLNSPGESDQHRSAFPAKVCIHVHDDTPSTGSEVSMRCSSVVVVVVVDVSVLGMAKSGTGAKRC